MLTGIAGKVGQIHLGTQIVRGKGLRPLVAAPDGLAIGVYLRQRRWSKLLPLAASCPHKKARRTQRLTTWYQGVSASEIREERGRVMTASPPEAHGHRAVALRYSNLRQYRANSPTAWA